uniref:Uncharacterized protein n=1 Tax=Aotus nancymaae TaxID=37293 RepID=A0A2K5D048_AOTNA
IGGTRPYSLHRALRPGAGQISPLVLRRQHLELGHNKVLSVASSTAGCGAAGPGPSAWAAEYIFYLSETSIFLGSNPSCHHIDIGSFLTVLSLITAVLVGPGPWSQLGAWVGTGPCCSSPSHQPVPVGPSTGLGWE